VADAAVHTAVVGLSNLWAQSGMKARHVALLVGVVAVYDLSATSLLPLTTDLIGRLAGLPFAPLVIWGTRPRSPGDRSG
jgi:hypothetical protein